jgi:hypothetical protein
MFRIGVTIPKVAQKFRSGTYDAVSPECPFASYPLVNVYIANWKDPPFSMGKWENPLFLWQFSIANC